MNKYVVKDNKDSKIFDSFKEARDMFKELISWHVKGSDNIFNDGIPFSVGADMNYLFDQGINKEEDDNAWEVLEQYGKALENMLDCSIELKYKREIEEFDETIELNAGKGLLEIDYKEGYSHNYLYTNGLDTTNEQMLYYFVSDWVCIIKGAEDLDELGAHYDTKIYMGPVSIEDIELAKKQNFKEYLWIPEIEKIFK